MKTIFLFILFTQNNIFLTLTTFKGEIIFWNSIGSLKIKNLKKLNNSAIKNFIFINLNHLYINKNFQFHIKIKGSNKLKRNFVKFLLNYLSTSILSFEDFLAISNNGCKLRKKRRL